MGDKYANLPGVVRDQPDTFETGSEVRPGPVNEPQRVADLPYQLDSEQDSPDKKVVETPEEKLARLQNEVKEVANVLAGDKQLSAATTAAVSLADQIKGLQEKLLRVRLESLESEQSTGSAAASVQEDLSKRIISQLAQFKVQAASAPDAAATPKLATPGDGGVVYQLYLRPEHAKMDSTRKAVELEQRLQRLERRVGAVSLAPAATALELPFASVAAAVAGLSARAHTVADEVVNELEGRIAQYEGVKKRQTADGSDYGSKVNDVYDLMHSWEAVAPTIPVVLARAKQVKALHDQAASFGSSLAQLDEGEQQLGKSISDQRMAVTKIEGLLSTSGVTIESHVIGLGKKVDALQAAAARLG